MKRIIVRLGITAFSFGAIALGLLPYNLANAADFKIGNVQQTFPTDALCVSLNPKIQTRQF